MGSVFQNPIAPKAKQRYIPKITKHEEQIQKMVAIYIKRQFPYIKYFLSDYAAGLHLTQNQARIRSSMNGDRGWSDMFIPYPSRGFNGLFIELKKDGTAIYCSRGPRKGKLVADEQIQLEAAFINDMISNGYFARFAVGFDSAQKILDWYFEKPQTKEIF